MASSSGAEPYADLHGPNVTTPPYWVLQICLMPYGMFASPGAGDIGILPAPGQHVLLAHMLAIIEPYVNHVPCHLQLPSHPMLWFADLEMATARPDVDAMDVWCLYFCYFQKALRAFSKK